MKKIAFIVNPAAGRGQSWKVWKKLRDHLNITDTFYKEFISEKEGEEKILGEQARKQGFNILISVGGDGTLHGIVNGLSTFENVTLGIIPTGTGNDLRRTLGINNNPYAALMGVLSWEPQPMDLGRAGDIIFCNIAGFGFDAQVAEEVNRGMSIFKGTAAYVAAVFHHLMRLNCPVISAAWDGGVWNEETFLIAAGNGRCYGGGLYITPNALINDGLFDVCLIKKVSRSEVIKVLPKVFKGGHLTHPAVTMIRTPYLTITGGSEVLFNADGEVNYLRTPVKIEVLPAAIKILKP